MHIVYQKKLRRTIYPDFRFIITLATTPIHLHSFCFYCIQEYSGTKEKGLWMDMCMCVRISVYNIIFMNPSDQTGFFSLTGNTQYNNCIVFLFIFEAIVLITGGVAADYWAILERIMEYKVLFWPMSDFQTDLFHNLNCIYDAIMLFFFFLYFTHINLPGISAKYPN